MPPWMVGLALLAPDSVAAPPRADPLFGPDKVKHAVVAFAIQGGGYAAMRVAAGHDVSLMAATIGSAGISLLKERYDRGSTGFSMRDLAWDAVGIALASLIVSHAPQR